MTESPPNIQPIEVSICGYEGPGITLICALKTDTNVVVIAAEEREAREVRREGFALVTNQHLDAADWLFTDDHIRKAIASYFTRSTQGTLDIIEQLGRHDPKNSIVKVGFDENGPRYQIAPDITNGQLAVLAACGFADRQLSLCAAESVADELAGLYSVLSF
jgi:hypothetical protein